MKKLIFSIVLMILPVIASAQMRFGYFSFNAVMKSMPEYVKAQQSIEQLRAKYDEEMKRAEQEFNAKYEDFLEVQHDLVPTILRKRQTELQDIMEKNIAFKADAQRLLRQAEVDALAPVKSKLVEAVEKVGRRQGYAFVINTDGDTCPFVNPEMGEDATEQILVGLGIK